LRTRQGQSTLSSVPSWIITAWIVTAWIVTAWIIVLPSMTLAASPAESSARFHPQQPDVASSASPRVTFSSLLNDFLDPMRPSRESAGAWNAWLATSRNPKAFEPSDPAWFTNDDRGHFLRIDSINGRDEWVLCDVDGPGAVTRIWTAMEATLANAVVRIYIDGAMEPTIEAPFYDWLRGRGNVPSPIATTLAPGGLAANVPTGSAAVSYLPIPFAKRCVVTLDRVPGYWQITGRRYREATPMDSLTREMLTKQRPELERIAREMLCPSVVPPSAEALPPNRVRASILTREAPISWERDTPGVIERVVVEIQKAPSEREALAEMLRSTWLECDFDDKSCVRAPIGHFFGLGECAPPVGDRMRTAVRREDGSLLLECRFAMPFTQGAQIRVTDRGAVSVSAVRGVVSLAVVVRDRLESDPSTPRLFHAMFREVRDVSNRSICDLAIARIEGEGEWIGTTLAILSPHAYWFGEGDEKVFVDDDPMQRQLGTGTEDFIGCAWGFPRVLSSDAVSVAPRPSMHRTSYEGRTTASRLRFLDGVPFTKRMDIDLEWVPPASFDRPAVVAATTFWYAERGRSRPVDFDDPPTMLANALPESMRKIAGAIEAESCAITGRAEGIEFELQDIGSLFPDAAWSGGRSIFVRPRAVGDWIRIEVPCGEISDGTPVRVAVRAIGAPDYGFVRFRVDGREAGPNVVDLRRDLVAPVPNIDLGVHEVRRGRCTIDIEAMKPADKVTARAGIFFGIDAFFITPVAK
jgi:hypothetical protein